MAPPESSSARKWQGRAVGSRGSGASGEGGEAREAEAAAVGRHRCELSLKGARVAGTPSAGQRSQRPHGA
eukprot:4849552-Alexandrium_andersonii.AAC.1